MSAIPTGDQDVAVDEAHHVRGHIGHGVHTPAKRVAGPLGEELGWRGTALPRLLTRWGAPSSSIVLGLFWWSFHTPGFFLRLFSPGFTPVNSLVGAIALTVLITWMFNNTGGSLIPGSLMHLSINFITSATGAAESPLFYGLTVAGLTLAAAMVVLVPTYTRTLRRWLMVWHMA